MRNDWEEAIKSYLEHVAASRKDATVRFYRSLLVSLAEWAEERQIALEDFGSSQLDAYINHRRKAGISDTTRRHDKLAAKTLMRWLYESEMLSRFTLARYTIVHADKPFVRMPTEEEIAQILKAVSDRWNPRKNPTIRFIGKSLREFHRIRDYAIILGLVDTACRIGELLNLLVRAAPI